MMQTDKMSDSGRLQALGEYLRESREAQEYSVAEVAERLFLSSNQVNAIEEARYESLPAEVFVKGYLRAYAKLLDLDPEEIVRQYQPVQVEPAPRPVVAKEEPAKRLLERMPDTPTTLVLGALAALVLLFLVSVVYFATSSDSVPEDAEQETAGEAADQQSAAMPNTDVSTDGSSQADGLDALEMRFSGDCWVEVRDASRKILLADMRRAGDTEIVQGEPPYKVVFGTSSAVAVRFQGRYVPVVPDTGKLSAQLVIGG